MARFDVFANPGGNGYLLDVQADILDNLNTVVVVPLMPVGTAPKPAMRLNPVFVISGVQHVMATQFIGSIPRAELSRPVTSLEGNAYEITNALDFLFQGF